MIDATFRDLAMLSVPDEVCPGPDDWAGRIRSLYEMLRFYADGFIRVYRTLGEMKNSLRLGSLDEDEYQWLINLANSLSLQISSIDLPISFEMSKTFMRYCEDRFPSQILVLELNHLFRSIELELRSVLFIQIPKNRQRYYELSKSELDESVHLHLHQIISDIEESSKCFALGRSTACVFHLMRVMEICVQIFGKKLKINLIAKNGADKTWHNILEEVTKAIKNMNPKTLKSKARHREYASIASHLSSVKIAWRNPVMHPKASYTEEEAEEVLRSVVIFVNHLASVL